MKQKGLVFSELESIERNKLAQHRRGFRLLDETDYVEHWAKRPGMDKVKAKAQFLADIKDKKILSKQLKVRGAMVWHVSVDKAQEFDNVDEVAQKKTQEGKIRCR